MRKIAIEELRGQLGRGEPFRLVDVRTPAEYRREHATGALSIPLDQFSHTRIEELPGEGPVYVICQSGARSSKACEGLQVLGTSVASVEGGTSAWARAGLSVERANDQSGISIERQVRIASGALVLLGVGLGLAVHPSLLGLAAVVGAGMLHSGLTDTCAMGAALTRLPWNRA